MLGTVKASFYVHVVLKPVFVRKLNRKGATERQTEDPRLPRHLVEDSHYLLRLPGTHIRNDVGSVFLDVELHELEILGMGCQLVKNGSFVYFVVESLEPDNRRSLLFLLPFSE